MSRRNVIVAVVGLLLGVGGMLFWLSPRPLSNGLDAELVSATRPLNIPFSQPLNPANPASWLTLNPSALGQWQVSGQSLVFFPTTPLIYGQTYTLTVQAGLPGNNGLPLLRTVRWQFTVASAPLLFLRVDEAGYSDVWQIRVASDEPPVRITDEPVAVWDYDAAAGSSTLLVVSEAADGSVDLVGYELDTGERRVLLDCPGQCENARWQPWGRLVAYESRPQTGAAAEIWLLDTTTGESWLAHPTATFTQLGLNLPTGQFPRWSADGRYLAYFVSEAQVIVILDMNGGEPSLIPATLDALGQWSPVAPILAYTEFARSLSQPHSHTLANGLVVTHTGAELYRHTVLANLVQAVTTDIARETEYNDGLAAWHPAGNLLAVPRSLFGEGAQIWLVDPMTGAGQAITDEALLNYSGLKWCPCGRELAYQLSPIDGSQSSAIWLYDSESQTHRLVQENEFLPGWLP